MIISYRGISPKLHPSVFVIDSAQIIGDVEIKEDSSVWFNAIIRGDVNFIRIGAHTNIQDHSVLHVTKDTHPLFVGDDITVGHSVTLHGCRIKDRCLIGIGAIVLDGAEVGEDCIIGAGAVVSEGAIIPPRSLALGVPAKVKRSLNDKDLSWIRTSAQNYISYVREYKQKGDIKKGTGYFLRK